MSDGLEYRSATLAGLSFPKRLIELVVMPYEIASRIFEHGREFDEIVSRGAFDGIETRNDRVRVNRDHDRTRPIGRAVAFHPSSHEGLVAEIKISNTDEGTATLNLADDGVLDASAGFGLLRRNGRTGPVVPDAEVWESRSRRRLNHLFLDHIAMVADPAHQTQVLAVRHTTEDEPAPVVRRNMAQLELREWQEKLAVIDSRYGLGQR